MFKRPYFNVLCMFPRHLHHVSPYVIQYHKKARMWFSVEIREKVIVPLGYGKFVRADKIIALEPIEENRGPGRRTMVFVEQMPTPIVASRTEQAILENIVQTPKEVLGAQAALEILRDLLEDINQVGPMLRKSIKKEAALDLEQFERKIREILGRQVHRDETP